VRLRRRRLVKATHCACWAHARRKFAEIKHSYPFALRLVEEIQRLYQVERDTLGASDAERLRIRRERFRPVIDRIGMYSLYNGIGHTRIIRWPDYLPTTHDPQRGRSSQKEGKAHILRALPSNHEHDGGRMPQTNTNLPDHCQRCNVVRCGNRSGCNEKH
jgi:hypothetical protein